MRLAMCEMWDIVKSSMSTFPEVRYVRKKKRPRVEEQYSQLPQTRETAISNIPWWPSVENKENTKNALLFFSKGALPLHSSCSLIRFHLCIHMIIYTSGKYGINHPSIDIGNNNMVKVVRIRCCWNQQF